LFNAQNVRTAFQRLRRHARSAAHRSNGSSFSVLRVFLMLLGVLGVFLSYANSWMLGIVLSVVFILLAAIAK
jgi:multisubunit Na+/H+ antiporter MnhG subunit